MAVDALTPPPPPRDGLSQFPYFWLILVHAPFQKVFLVSVPFDCAICVDLIHSMSQPI